MPQGLVDDSFYVFSIARQLGYGRIPSVDGIHLTNGFQPLIAYLYVPLSWIAGDNRWLFVRLTFVLNAFFFVGTLLLIYRLVVLLTSHRPIPFQTSAGLLAAFLATVSFAFFQHTTNGLETGLVTLLLTASLHQYAVIARCDTASVREWTELGALLGLAVLARIDSVFLVVAIAVSEVIRRNVKGAVTMSGVAFIVSVPWWIFNLAAFGSLMPISGQAERSYGASIAALVGQSFETLSDILYGIFYLPSHLDWIVRLLILIVLIAIGCAVFRGIPMRGMFDKAVARRTLLPYVFFCLALIIYYTFFFGASHFIVRYLQPIRLLWFIIAPVAILAALRAPSPIFLRRLRYGLVLCWIVGGSAFGVNRYLTDYQPSPFRDFYYAGLWAQHTKAPIGMLQSGTTEFMAANVTNLDGKVNSDALRARLRGTFGEYVMHQHFEYLADWAPLLKEVTTQTAKYGVTYDSVAMIGKMEILRLHHQ